MTVKHTLHTYGCLHFALIPITPTPTPTTSASTTTPDNNESPKDKDSNKPLTTFDALWHTPTHVHTTTKKYCGKAKCNLLNSRKLRGRARHSLDNLDGYLSDAMERYMELGIDYHNIPFHARASMSDAEMCQLAHQQFGIEIRNWNDDGFFEKWIALQRRVKRVRENLEELDEGLIQVVNSCRGLVGEIEGMMQKLDSGTKFLEYVWLELWGGFDGVGKEKGKVVDRVERWVFEKWRRRIVGLKDRFYVEEEEE